MESKRGFEEVSKEYKHHDGRLKIKLPERKTNHSAGYDFHTPATVTIPAGKSAIIYTDVKAYMQDDEVLKLFIRSSLGFKGLILSNLVPVIDSDYHNNDDNDGNIIIKVKNTSDKLIRLKKNERVVQGIFQKFLVTDDDENIEKEDRNGGIGSTDKE